jgi:zeaxanthin glucosyltransferase
MTILFAMAGEAGHHVATFRLARALASRGHRVLYLGLARMAALVESQGFPYLTFAGDLVPAIEGPPIGRRAAKQRLAAFLERIEGGELDHVLRSAGPGLVLCDPLLWYVGLRALRLGIPTVNLPVVLMSHANAVVPPISCGLDPTSASPFRVRAEWARLRARALLSRWFAPLSLPHAPHPLQAQHMVDVFLRAAPRSGYRCAENETYFRGEFGPYLALPELVLCPRAFQLPGVSEKNRVYLADFVDLDRAEEPMAVGTRRPLVLASLGTAAPAYPHAPRFFRAVAEASRLRPDWQLVLHVGDHPRGSALGGDTANLLVRDRVPQIALLRQASAMVTHGGLNSIMECVHLGVPMVIVPGLRDQPGNALRARHHHLALTARMDRITAAEMVALLEQAMSDASLREALARFRQKIAEEPGMAGAIDFIESHAEGRGLRQHAGRSSMGDTAPRTEEPQLLPRQGRETPRPD